jgi:phosphopantetheinyl transferase
MPVVNFGKINDKIDYAVWRISENKEELLQNLSMEHKGCLIEIENACLIRQLHWMSSRMTIEYLLKKLSLTSSQVEKNDNGKPFISQYNLNASIAHSHMYSIAALSGTFKIGVDVQKIDCRLYHIKKKYLQPQEEMFCGKNLVKLCIIWCAKESIYKATTQKVFLKNIYIPNFEKLTSGYLKATLNNEHFVVNYKKFQNYIYSIAYAL